MLLEHGPIERRVRWVDMTTMTRRHRGATVTVGQGTGARDDVTPRARTVVADVTALPLTSLALVMDTAAV